MTLRTRPPSATIAAVAAVSAATALATRSRRRPTTAISAPTAASTVHRVTTSDRITLHARLSHPRPARSAEPRPTVVMTHGYCLNEHCWDAQVSSLVAAGYPVVTWDLRGHGRSDAGAPELDTFEQLARDLDRVLDTMAGDRPVALVGHSLGGMTMLNLARLFPERVRGRVVAAAFVASSPGGMAFADVNPLTRIGYRTMSSVIDPVLTPLSERPRTWRALRPVVSPVVGPLVDLLSFASPVSQQVARRTTTHVLNTNLDVIHRLLGQFDTYDAQSALGEFSSMPVLVFHGSRDLLTPPAHSSAFVEALPHARAIEVPDGGHIITLEHPQRLNSALLDLLNQSLIARGT